MSITSYKKNVFGKFPLFALAEFEGESYLMIASGKEFKVKSIPDRNLVKKICFQREITGIFFSNERKTIRIIFTTTEFCEIRGLSFVPEGPIIDEEPDNQEKEEIAGPESTPNEQEKDLL